MTAEAPEWQPGAIWASSTERRGLRAPHRAGGVGAAHLRGPRARVGDGPTSYVVFEWFDGDDRGAGELPHDAVLIVVPAARAGVDVITATDLFCGAGGSSLGAERPASSSSWPPTTGPRPSRSTRPTSLTPATTAPTSARSTRAG